MRVFKTEVQVRGYELDGYGHANHAVYLNYAEHARWKMIEEAAGGMDYFKRNGVAPVIVRAEVDYRVPCLLGEWLVIETSVVEIRTRVAKFKQVISKKSSGQIAAEALMTAVVVDSSGKAVKMPEDFTAVFQ